MSSFYTEVVAVVVVVVTVISTLAAAQRERSSEVVSVYTCAVVLVAVQPTITVQQGKSFGAFGCVPLL